MASSKGNIATKATPGKRKIEIKKVEQKNKRNVAFSKRKQGLFNKVTELSILCQAETALIVTSPQDKLYSCGYPTPDAVIHRFLTGGSPVGGAGKGKQQKETVETLRLEYEAIQDHLKEELKKYQQVMITEGQKSSYCSPFWWNLSIEEMGLECLEDFKTSMEHLRLNLVAAMEGKRLNSLPPMPLAMAPPPALSNRSLIQDGNNSGTSFMFSGFGHF